MTVTVKSVQVGRIAPLGPNAVPSGYAKQAVKGPVSVSYSGLAGDEQADLSVHGGPDKAVYGYAAHHYPAWQADFPHHAELFTAGAMGENLTMAGLDEADIALGDVHRVGTALLQVCQPRQPCFKLAAYFGDAKLPRAMVRTGRSGWYYRVLEEGVVAAGDTVSLAARSREPFPFSRLVAIVNGGTASRAEADVLRDLPELAASLRAAFARR